MKQDNKSTPPVKRVNDEDRIDEKVDFSYPPEEDIYNNAKEEQDIDPEDISNTKAPNDDQRYSRLNEKGFTADVSGDDLDIPGAELDDEQEDIGSEDEENNGYSLGQR
jgi:hypothetical protein